jgi:hypothetical protein
VTAFCRPRARSRSGSGPSTQRGGLIARVSPAVRYDHEAFRRFVAVDRVWRPAKLVGTHEIQRDVRVAVLDVLPEAICVHGVERTVAVWLAAALNQRTGSQVYEQLLLKAVREHHGDGRRALEIVGGLRELAQP